MNSPKFKVTELKNGAWLTSVSKAHRHFPVHYTPGHPANDGWAFQVLSWGARRRFLLHSQYAPIPTQELCMPWPIAVTKQGYVRSAKSNFMFKRKYLSLNMQLPFVFFILLSQSPSQREGSSRALMPYCRDGYLSAVVVWATAGGSERACEIKRLFKRQHNGWFSEQCGALRPAGALRAQHRAAGLHFCQ